MNGDFSRTTFERRHRFSRVLMQQGRVLLDADWNEQTSILLHYVRTLAADLIGPHGGPGEGFRIVCADEHGNGNADHDTSPAPGGSPGHDRHDDPDPRSGADAHDPHDLGCDFIIRWGHYYVDGILCENLPARACPPATAPPPPLRYTAQPDYPLADADRLQHNRRYLVYLDVWERHLTQLEAPQIREVALGGPDTATRARIVWQVRVADESRCGPDRDDLTCEELLRRAIRDRPRCLRARARVDASSDDPCIIPPEARYRGPENQLYRVEIHEPGEAGSAKHGATFKWSRDNGSVVFAIRSLQGSLVTLDSLGPDDCRGLHEGDWVEIVDDRTALRGVPGVLARVDAIDRVRAAVSLAVPDGVALPTFAGSATTHPLLRRWDQRSDARPVQEGKWIDLEDGVQVYFETGGAYRTGDYWLIPARTATGDVLWPTARDADGTPSPRALPPHGIEHHYAPLARISLDATGAVTCEHDCRCTFVALCADGVRHAHHAIEHVESNRPNQPTTPTQPAQPSQPQPVNEIVLIRDATPGRDLDLVREGEPTREPTPGTGTVGGLTVNRAAAVAELRAISEIGNARANILIDSGHDSVLAIAEMPVEEVRNLLGVREDIAVTISESARLLSLQR